MEPSNFNFFYFAHESSSLCLLPFRLILKRSGPYTNQSIRCSHVWLHGWQMKTPQQKIRTPIYETTRAQLFSSPPSISSPSLMAAFLQRRGLQWGRAFITQNKSLSSEALVEIKPGEIGIVSGIPEEHLNRKVLIYSPAKTATQQGSGKVGKWKINFLSTQKWENPLMGWTSTGDPYANVGDSALYFDSEEAAKAFAEKHGWNYLVKKRHAPVLKVKSYAENFKWKGPCKAEA